MSTESPIAGDQPLETWLRERHSCRAFLPEPVPRAVIERILALAQRTASWCNCQPWQVAVTEARPPSGCGRRCWRAPKSPASRRTFPSRRVPRRLSGAPPRGRFPALWRRGRGARRPRRLPPPGTAQLPAVRRAARGGDQHRCRAGRVRRHRLRRLCGHLPAGGAGQRWPRCRRRPWPCIPRCCARRWTSIRRAAWSAAFPLVMKTRPIRPTAIAPAALPWTKR